MMPTASRPLPEFFGDAAQAWAAAHPWIMALTIAVALVVVAWLAYKLTRTLLSIAINRIAARTSNLWDDALKNRRVFRRLSRLVPLLILQAGSPYLLVHAPGASVALERVLSAAMILVVARALGAAVNAFGDVYARRPDADQHPIKGYLQGTIIVVYLFAAIVIIGTLLNRDPLLLLSGIGAASAVLLLIFRDTILGLVAGIQLTNNDLIRVGDWIEMPQFNADGDVVDIGLNKVTVQNWDKTLTIIPAQHFLDNAFKNWRGMQVSGGRRIMRNIRIDVNTIRFLSPDDVEDLKRFALLRSYFEEKREDITTWIQANPVARENPVNSRRLTNIGTFRAYVGLYLRARPDISEDLTFLVRQLAPDAQGLPIEIYVFVADVRWDVYEGVQSDIFDHLLAILPEFGLRAFQSPTGADVLRLARSDDPRSDEAREELPVRPEAAAPTQVG